MNKHSILFIGLDTHKEFNEVAYIEEHRGTNLRKYKPDSHLNRTNKTVPLNSPIRFKIYL